MKLVTKLHYFNGRKPISFYESRPALTEEVVLSLAQGFLSSCTEFIKQPNFSATIEIQPEDS